MLLTQHFRCPLIATALVRRGFHAACFRCGAEVLFLFVVRRGMGMGVLRKSFVRSLGESHRRAASRGGE